MLVDMAICREVIDAQQTLATSDLTEPAFFIGFYYFGHMEALLTLIAVLFNGRYLYALRNSPCNIPDDLLLA
jgi:hypothetical protein